MIIIPAIDIMDGKCVRLIQGDYNQKKNYAIKPVEFAKQLQDIGIIRLHVVDLDGAKLGEVKNLKTVEEIANKTNVQIDFSGGINSLQMVKNIFNAGIKFVSIGSMAVKNIHFVQACLSHYSPNQFIIGADVKNELICIHGWIQQTDIQLLDFLKQYMELGIYDFFCTDISLDGLLQGPSLALYKKILKTYPKIQLIASGGVSSMVDIMELEKMGCSGVIVGKALYENKISLTAIQKYIQHAH
ncbi:MAG: 1-(5-phosphoribosyl)-5-[(5-phosphoribosylamino)methylideneamino]imidazole-4-carboxamide isomerase [Sediminibacterium sp.]|nr:1-(5-phosphoribosyl)-5-[(5-phosphoribosylamino)methylideneamino]imidazole-4-carboxamide isomerase [Sediminibacterium sp.]